MIAEAGGCNPSSWLIEKCIASEDTESGSREYARRRGCVNNANHFRLGKDVVDFPRQIMMQHELRS